MGDGSSFVGGSQVVLVDEVPLFGTFFWRKRRGLCFRRKKSKALMCWVGIVGLGLLDVFIFTSFFGPPED